MAAEWDPVADLFDGTSARDPISRLFAASPQEARGNLDRHLARDYKDLQRIYTRFLNMENLPSSQAFKFTLNPR